MEIKLHNASGEKAFHLQIGNGWAYLKIGARDWFRQWRTA